MKWHSIQISEQEHVNMLGATFLFFQGVFVNVTNIKEQTPVGNDSLKKELQKLQLKGLLQQIQDLQQQVQKLQKKVAKAKIKDLSRRKAPNAKQ